METNTPLPQQPDHRGWTDRFKSYGQEWQETHSPNVLDFTSQAPIILNLIADWHIGHPTTHVDRITQEVETIARKRNSFVFLLGDMIDNMGWNPGQYEQKQTPDQILFFRSLLDYLSDKNKLLLYVQGDHDGWLMRSGYDPKQEAIQRGVHGTIGATEVNLKVGEYEKRIGVAHQLPGNSIYNRNHPQRRALNVDGAFHGADVVASGHNHQKANQRTYVNEWGISRPVELIALGAYKPSDSWLSKKGYKEQRPDEMYGTSIKIDSRRGEIVVFDDIIKANK